MKIDVTKIDGYENMSAEDKLKALEGYEFDVPTPKDNSEEVKNLKESLSKANSQAAEWKRQFREKQTEAEREKAVEEELKSLRRDKSVSGYVAQCLALGYSAELAQKAAEAMADGNTSEIFACQQAFLEAKQKEIEAAALNKQPTLTSGSPPTAKQADHDAINRERSWFGLPPLK